MLEEGKENLKEFFLGSFVVASWIAFTHHSVFLYLSFSLVVSGFLSIDQLFGHGYDVVLHFSHICLSEYGSLS